MRDYAQISPRFWTGETGKKLRGHPEAQLVALYLMSAPGSHMIGMYPLELPTLCHHTGISHEGATKGLARLAALDFSYFDDVAELIWVPEMAAFQIDRQLKRGDNRIKGVEKELENYRKSRFFNAFIDRYEKAFNLTIERDPKLALEGPSKPLQSQEQEQEQEQEKDKASSAAPTANGSPLPLLGEPSAAVQVFNEWCKVMGKTEGAKFTPERKRKVEARLKDGYSLERIFKAIRGNKLSPHHQGKNESGTVYDDLELICRDGKHVETFERFADQPPAPAHPGASIRITEQAKAEHQMPGRKSL